MKSLFALLFAFMLVCTVVIQTVGRPVPPAGKTPLVWTSDDNPLRKQQIGLFNRLHPALSLSLDPANEGMEKVIVQSLAGVGPDLFDCRDASQLSAYVKAGIAWDVTDELAKLGIDVPRDVWPCVLPLARLEGRVYGVPTNVGAAAVWLNKDLFERDGVPPPRGSWTWGQFVPLAQRLTLRSADGRVKQFGFLFDWYNWPHFIYGFGGRTYNADGTRCVLDSPEAVAGIQMMQDLVYRYRVSPSPVEEASLASQGGWGSGTINLFGAKRAAMALGGRWWLANLRNFENLELGAVESPYGAVRAYGAAARVTLVNRNSPRRREALLFLAYLASPQYNKLLTDQADGTPAFPRYMNGPDYLLNPQYPKEDFNEVWRTATAFSTPGEASPYVNGQVASRLINKQIDLVRINAKSAQQAMRDAARDVNRAMREALREDPALRRRWEAATGERL